MTLDRDIRFTPDQIIATQKALRQRRNALTRSIEKADANRRAGVRIQHGVYEEHVNELYHIARVLDSLEVARLQVARRIADKVNA